MDPPLVVLQLAAATLQVAWNVMQRGLRINAALRGCHRGAGDIECVYLEIGRRYAGRTQDGCDRVGLLTSAAGRGKNAQRCATVCHPVTRPDRDLLEHSMIAEESSFLNDQGIDQMLQFVGGGFEV